MINILHTETLKKWGGQQKRVLSEITELKKRGYKIVLACNKDSVIAKKSKNEGIKVYELDFKKTNYLRTIPKLIKIIKTENIDIISTHSSTDSWAAGIAAKLTGRKFVRFKHNMFPIGKDPLTKFIYHIPDKFIAISDPIKDLMEQYGIDSSKITVIPTSVDTERFNPDKVKDLRNYFSIPKNAIVIGNISGFAKQKAQHILFQAFDLVSKKYSCFLLMAGNISERGMQEYLHLVSKSIQNKIIFTGYREDIPSILKSIDIYVSSAISEGLSIAVLEAMAMEKAVIVSDIPAFKSFIIDNYNGLIFKSENVEDLANKILYLIENENLRKKLRKNARKTILDRFSLEKMIEDTEKVYKSLVNAE
ncbi:glycosyltransferase [Thermodesulfovibrio aggregans]|uniref:Glycosyltransferase n=1 Tax=Thermodesulfovibrio aggregans TaxID=86166 RepID=A0A0U9HND8_9BACT|nr:glycosyltransferase family 4 protein [Thermodesulfovibrio aggregans]GAQ94584.1 glycosyltransferase [Thermodesulfovibrio aggregans]